MKTLMQNNMIRRSKEKCLFIVLKAWAYLLLMAAMPSAWAQTLDDYLLMAAENNPELQAEFARYQASLEEVPQAGALPDPENGMGKIIQKMATMMGNQNAEMTIMVMFT